MHDEKFTPQQRVKMLSSEVGQLKDAVTREQALIDEKAGSYDVVRNKLIFLNSEINNIENYFKQRSEDANVNNAQLVEQKKQVFVKYRESVSSKVRITLQNFFMLKYGHQQLEQQKTGIKMEVSSVCVIMLKENPFIYVDKIIQKEISSNTIPEEQYVLPFFCANFVITKLYRLKDRACNFWSLREDDYLIADHCFNSLELLYQDNADSYFAVQKEQNSYAYIFLWKKEPKIDFIFDEQKELIQFKAENKESTKEASDAMLRLIKDIKDFVHVQPGLELYKGLDAKKKVNVKSKQSGKPGAVFTTLMLILNLISLIILYQTAKNAFNYEQVTYLKQSVTNYLINDGESDVDYKVIYQKMKDLSLIEKTGNTETLKFRFLNYLRPARILQVRSSKYDCTEMSLYINITDCYYPIYSSKNKQTSDLVNKQTGKVENWQKYLSKSEAQVTPFSGDISEYDGSGYLIEIDFYDGNFQVDELEEWDLIDQHQTKMVLFDLVIYDINRRMFFVIYLFYELMPSGLIRRLALTQQLNFRYFTKDENNSNVLEYLQITITTILTFSLIYSEIREVKQSIINEKNNFLWKRDIIHVVTLPIIYNMIVLILIYVVFFLLFNNPPFSIEDLIKGQMTNYFTYSKQYMAALRLKGFLILLVGFNLLMNIKTSASMIMIRNMIHQNLSYIIMIGILFFSMVLALSLLYSFSYGSKVYDFLNIFNSFMSLFRMYFFGIDSLYTKCQQIDPVVNSIILIVVFIAIKYGILVLINSILQESYRTCSYNKAHEAEVKEFYSDLRKSGERVLKKLKGLCRLSRGNKKH